MILSFLRKLREKLYKAETEFFMVLFRRIIKIKLKSCIRIVITFPSSLLVPPHASLGSLFLPKANEYLQKALSYAPG